MLKTFFISQSIKSLEIDRFIRQQFPAGDYSEIEIQNTPLGTKIVIYTNKPGKIIGKGGFNIDRITETLRVKFSLENGPARVGDLLAATKRVAGELARRFPGKIHETPTTAQLLADDLLELAMARAVDERHPAIAQLLDDLVRSELFKHVRLPLGQWPATRRLHSAMSPSSSARSVGFSSMARS